MPKGRDVSRAVLVLPVALVTAWAVSSPAAVAGVRNPCPAGLRTCVLDQPGTYRYVVPAGVHHLRIAVSGAQGGGRGGSLGDFLAAGVPERFGAGGEGGRIDADVAVRPGQRLIVVIGRMGAPGEIARYNDPAFIAPGGRGGDNGGGSGGGGLSGLPGGGGSGYADPAWCSDIHAQTGTHHGDGLVVITPR